MARKRRFRPRGDRPYAWFIDYNDLTDRQRREIDAARPEAMLRIKKAIQRHDQGTVEQIVYSLLRDAQRPEDGYTLVELMLELYKYAIKRKSFCNKVAKRGTYKDLGEKAYDLAWSKKQLFDEWVRSNRRFQYGSASHQVRVLITRLKRNEKNKWVAIDTKRPIFKEDGKTPTFKDRKKRALYFNAQKSTDLKDTELRRKQTIEGLVRQEKQQQDVVSTNKKRRKKLEQQVEDERLSEYYDTQSPYQ